MTAQIAHGQQGVVRSVGLWVSSALLGPKRLAPGSCEVSRRRTPRIIATRMAAVRPFPETSPTMAMREPSGAETTKKKWPRTSLAARETDATWRPGAGAGGPERTSAQTVRGATTPRDE